MARRLCQFLFTLAILYALAVGGFAYFNYQSPRPDVLTIAGDMHGWVMGRFRSTPAPTLPPGSIPPLSTDVVPAPAPDVPAAPPEDDRSRAIAKVRDEFLPAVDVIIRKMDDPGAQVQVLKVEAAALLTKARDLLGAQLDLRPDDAEVQKLNKRVQDLRAAVGKR